MYLTEQEIARRAIKFLRHYYKHRDRDLEAFFETKQNMVSDTGIIADGYIRFKLEDGSFFEATIEATSFAKQEEIKYRRLDRLLRIDSFAISFLLSSLLMWILFIGGYLRAYSGRFLAFWGIFLLALVILYPLCWWALSWLPRYRYIYSIEQFRRYQVNEQWIAFDAKLFPVPEDKYFNELRRQCLKWGIGLLRIEEKTVIPKMTPSREGEFKNRKKAKFFKVGTVIPKLDALDFARQILRYRKGATNQFLLILVGIFFLAFTFYQFYKTKPFDHWDEEKINEVVRKVEETGPEPAVGWVEPEYYIPFNEKVKPYLDLQPTLFVRQSSEKDVAPRIFVLTDKKVDIKQPPVTSGDLCRGIPASPDDKYIIQLGAYRSNKHALQRKKVLNLAGITTDIYSCGCLGRGAPKLNCVIYIHPVKDTIEGKKFIQEFEAAILRDSLPGADSIWLRPVKEL